MTRPKIQVIVDQVRGETDTEGLSLKYPDARRIFVSTEYEELDLSEVVTPSLEEIRIVCPNMTDIDLSPMSICKNLTKLMIQHGLKLNRIDLFQICFDNLRNLHIHNCGISALDLSPLIGASVLREIRIEETQLQSIDLAPLMEVLALEDLNLTENKLSFIDLSPLSSLKDLRFLRLGNNQISDIDLSPLASMSIKEIELESQIKVKELDISPLFSCHELIRFRFSAKKLRASAQARVIPIPVGLRGLQFVEYY